MKSIQNIFSLVLVLTLFGSCANDNQSKTPNKLEKKSSESLAKTFSKESTSVGFTAFKTTDKVGVNGKFEDFSVDYNKDFKNADELLNSVKFEIPVSSLSTGNPGRDQLIKTFFFGVMTNTETIKGSFANAQNNQLDLTLNLNGVEYSQKANYQLKGDSIFVNTNIEMANWNALPAVESLNEKCLNVHKGPDGVSKTWSDVDVNIVSVLK
jgi:polyisoprenoid-binding protein YceI